MKSILTLLLLSIGLSLTAQTTTQYEISFDNAVHHEADINITYTNLPNKVLEVRMSRTSPGRYAIHEFAKNVYSVSATDSKGQDLPVTRPNPHQWNVAGHDGTVNFSYTLFANRAGGTYTGFDASHAHMNIPATFAYARGLEHRPIELKINTLPSWSVATQLVAEGENRFSARDLAYFMDSPIEAAEMHWREEMVNGQAIKLALHTPATEAEVDAYFAELMGIVKQQAAVYGELPTFDYGSYTFLSCYMPNASGDGMEHRNSTVVTSTKSLDKPLGTTSMGTISHEFFHCWNVERIRPRDLEPFDLEEANMCGELWFAEGFTSYYTNLIRARSGSISREDYVNQIGGAINYVIEAPGRKYHNPIEMSYQAPFVDAAKSVDPVNRNNTFISYYTYGSVLGLGLDLSLRTMDGDLNLDDYMKQVWTKYGKSETPYTVRDLQAELVAYAGAEFGNHFFENYIFDSELPDYEKLLDQFGVDFAVANPGMPSLGNNLRLSDEGVATLYANALVGSPLYDAGIEYGDEITSIGGKSLANYAKVSELLSTLKVGEKVAVVYKRHGVEKSADVVLEGTTTRSTQWNPKVKGNAKKRLDAWLAKR